MKNNIKIMKISQVLQRRNYTSIKTPSFKKMFSAKIIDDNGVTYQFKSARNRIFFERRCDLTNALNYAFGVSCCYEWQKSYGDSIIIEERYIKLLNLLIKQHNY